VLADLCILDTITPPAVERIESFHAAQRPAPQSSFNFYPSLENSGVF